ncbi:hypothetical protein KP509_28G069000 [Ceratopteris richardii]|nr:hypothetical protein KP509_28G069000 [Ceratopteris richardii]
MLQHQVRGEIEVLDDCSFSVTKFDMVAGKDVRWWGAKGEDFQNMMNGFVISRMHLNQTLKNESMVVTLDDCTWDDFSVLGIWDIAFESDYGHVTLPISYIIGAPVAGLSPAVAPTLSPGLAFVPSPGKEVDEESVWGKEQPTMLDNCKELSDVYRLRWTLNIETGTVDLGLEAAIPYTHYMAFGWAKPESTSSFMLNADVAVAGFHNQTAPFVEDYHINKYSECSMTQDGPASVCPSSLYPRTHNDTSKTTNVKFIYGQWQDGVAFIRFRKGLQSSSRHLDVSVSTTSEMMIIWALGVMKEPDSLWPWYLPEKHTSFGHVKLNLSKALNECKGPLQAPNFDDSDLLTTEPGIAILVTVGPAIHNPNPPHPDEVIYFNKVESPVLKVERGVPVTFSIQAGHAVAFYISENPVGGEPEENTMIFAGGPHAHGVPASPYYLTWKPDRFTPDEVYYHSYFQKKMGWKIRVVDGGLNDMYNSTVYLADQKVRLYWMITEAGVSFAVKAVPKSGYVAIGFGKSMVHTFAYVGWLDGAVCKVGTYWIDGRDAASIHRTNETLTDVQCAQQNGILTFQFSRPLDPHCTSRQECQNIIDPSIPLKVVWALGTLWKPDHLTGSNMHSSKSSRYMSVHLTKGVAEPEQELRPVLAVHGFMMFMAWALLFPGGVLAALYLRHLENDGWFQIHLYAQYSGLAIMSLGVLFAVAETGEFRTGSLHAKLGLTSIGLACAQPLNAYFRSRKAAPGEQQSLHRVAWLFLHRYTGGAALFVGIITLWTGIFALSNEYSGDQMTGLDWALAGWLFCIFLLTVYLERSGFRNIKSGKESVFVKGKAIDQHTDSANLLRPKQAPFMSAALDDSQRYPAKRKEVQLQVL